MFTFLQFNHNKKIMKFKFLLSIIVIFFLFNSCGTFKDKISGEKRNELIKSGKKAIGEITKVEDTNITLNYNPKVNIYVRVKPDNEDEFDAVVTMFVSKVAVPRKGDNVNVYYNPKDKTEIVIE
jgi:hypothetical protein